MILALACSGSSARHPYPFRSGDRMVYAWQDPSGVRIVRIFIVEAEGDGFVVRRRQRVEAPNGEFAEKALSLSEKVYDKFGRLLRLADGRSGSRSKGHYCFLWLNPDMRKSGVRVPIAEAAEPSRPLVEETRDGRFCLILRIGNGEWIYDQQTGYLTDGKGLGRLLESPAGVTSNVIKVN